MQSARLNFASLISIVPHHYKKLGTHQMSAPRITPEKTNNYDFVHDAAAKRLTQGTYLRQYIEEMKINIDVLHSVYGEPPVSFAAQSGTSEILRYLIMQGANLDASGRKRNLLYWAAQNTQAVIQYVTDPDLDIQAYFLDGTNRLSVAIVGNRLEEVEKIIKDDPAQVVQTSANGRSPIYWAALVNNSEAFALLSQVVKNYDQEPEYFRGRIDRIRDIEFGTTSQLRMDIKSFAEVIKLYLRLNALGALQGDEIKTCLDTVKNMGSYYLDRNDWANATSFYQTALDFAKEKMPEDTNDILDRLSSIRSRRAFFKVAKEYGITRLFVDDARDFFHLLIIEMARVCGGPKPVGDLLEAKIADIQQHILKYQDLYSSNHKESDLGEDVVFVHAMARCFKLNVAIFKLNDGEPDVTIFKCSKTANNLYLCYSKEMGFQISQRMQIKGEVAMIDVLIESADEEMDFDSMLMPPIAKTVDMNTNLFGGSNLSNLSKQESSSDFINEETWSDNYEDEDEYEYDAPSLSKRS